MWRSDMTDPGSATHQEQQAMMCKLHPESMSSVKAIMYMAL